MIDEEEVSLSDSSLGGSSSDDDTSGDEEGYEDSGMTDSSSMNNLIDEEDEKIDDMQFGQSDSALLYKHDDDEYGSQLDTHSKLLYRRTSSVIPPSQHQKKHNMSVDYSRKLSSLSKNSLLGREKSNRVKYLDASEKEIPVSLTLTIARQHVQFARSCLELLNEKDRQDALRRRNIRQTLLNENHENNNNSIDNALDVDEEECPLLTMIKSGPLYKLHAMGGKASRRISRKMKKKHTASIGTRLLIKWKPKFVEVRKGMLTYYNDSSKMSSSRKRERLLMRKNIPLQVSTCVCRAVDYFGTNKGNIIPEDERAPDRLYAFELVVDGLPVRLFAAETEAGRQAWIQSISKGMVGSSKSKGKGGDGGANNMNDLQMKSQMQALTNLSQAATDANNTTSYVNEFASALWGAAISVPISSLWGIVSPPFVKNNTIEKEDGLGEPQNELERFWHKLKDFEFILNEQLLRGYSIHGPERIFGTLMRIIIQCENSTSDDNVSEIQAAKYARDILKVTAFEYMGRVSAIGMAVKSLCNNRKGLVKIESQTPIESPIIKIKVSAHQKKEHDSNVDHRRSKVDDRREWIHVRASKSSSPKRSFVVLSVGVLCFYKEAFPRPHKLIEQFILSGTRVGYYEQTGDIPDNSSVSSAGREGSMISSEVNSNLSSSDAPKMKTRYVIFVESKDRKRGRRQLCFGDYEQFIGWRHALVSAIEGCSSPQQLLEDVNPLSMDELHDQRPPPQSTLAQMFQDNDGITWYSLPSTPQRHKARTHHSSFIRSSRLLSKGEMPSALSRRVSDSYWTTTTLSAFHWASMRLLMNPESKGITSTISSIPGRAMSIASRHFSTTNNETSDDVTRAKDDDLLDDDVVLTTSDKPTVKVEMQFSTFHYVYTKNASDKPAT